MPGVQFSGPNNSTLFTTCCGVAICDDERRCPVCQQEVPGDRQSRWEEAMLRRFGKERLAKMRAANDEKWRRAGGRTR